ncbi:LysE family translocator [Actinomadura monticuli]|uniref:LysE family translocator n=1 Tax=Actinomadura monticuli TaxID=3097367 RepID=A0ABV4QEA8_9ACTN
MLAFWTVALLLIVIPGPDWVFTIGAGLRGRSVVSAVSGLVVGYGAITVVVAAGVGAMVAGSPSALTVLSLVGGAYLIWQGASTFAHPAPPAAEPETRTDWATFLRGIGVSGFNPKGLLIFLALLPQFTDPGGSWPIAGQIGVLGLTFMGTCAVWYLGLGILARTVLDGAPGTTRLVGRLAGVAMIALGAYLVLDRL